MKGTTSWLMMEASDGAEVRSGTVDDRGIRRCASDCEVNLDAIRFEAVGYSAGMLSFAYRVNKVDWVGGWNDIVSTKMFEGSDKLSRDGGVLTIKGISCHGTGGMLKFILDDSIVELIELGCCYG